MPGTHINGVALAGALKLQKVMLGKLSTFCWAQTQKHRANTSTNSISN